MVLRSNRISTLNKNKTHSTNIDSLTTYKRKLLESRKGTNTNLFTRKQTTTEEYDSGVSIQSTNVIYCPDCRNLIDIKDILDNNQDLTNVPVRCKTCGNTDIDLILELKKQNKLELISSGGIPSGELFNISNRSIKDQIVRPRSVLKKQYQKDIDTNMYIRKTNPTTLNKSSRNKGINREFIETYDELLTDQEKVIYQPMKSMIDKAGVKITRVIDIN